MSFSGGYTIVLINILFYKSIELLMYRNSLFVDKLVNDFDCPLEQIDGLLHQVWQNNFLTFHVIGTT